jgi:hypothetical protein
LLETFTFADQLLAYHDAELMDNIRGFLIDNLSQASEEIRQYIWRILVIGWYKFARNKEQSYMLLNILLKESKLAPNPKSIEEEKKDDGDEVDKVEEVVVP